MARKRTSSWIDKQWLVVRRRRVDVLSRSRLDKVYNPKRANRVDAPYTCTLQAASRLWPPLPPKPPSADPADGSSSSPLDAVLVVGLVLVVGAWLVDVVVSS